jgi:hypothetical protein
MLPVNIDGISLDRFSEPVTVGILRKTRCSAVPQSSGIYLVLRMADCLPEFLAKSTGGAFKKKDPTCPAEFLCTNWVQGAHVVYVGKAAGRQGLRRRLDDLIAFGYGEAVGHWGGRLLWHLPEKEKLLVRWRTCSAGDADKEETNAIGAFRSLRAMRPYANLRK